MAQFLRPNSDLALGTWITSPLFEKIDEVTASDADFVECPDNSNSTFGVGLSTASTPIAGTRTLRVRARKGASAGNTRGLNYNLKESGVTVQSGTINAALTEVYSTVSITISNTVTDYNALSLELTSTGTTGGAGGNRRTVEVSWAEFEIPNAPIPNIWNESLTFSGSSTLTPTGTVTFTQSISVVGNGDFAQGGQASLNTNLPLNTSNTATFTPNQILNLVLLVDSISNLNMTGAEIQNLDESLTFDSNLGALFNGFLNYVNSLNLPINTTISLNLLANYFTSISLNTSNSLLINAITNFVISLNLGTTSNAVYTALVNITKNISLLSNSLATFSGTSTKNLSIGFNATSFLETDKQIIFNESISFSGNADYADQGINQLTKIIDLATSSNANFNGQQVIQAILALSAFSTLTVEEFTEGVVNEQLALLINNNIVFNALVNTVQVFAVSGQSSAQFNLVAQLFQQLDLNVTINDIYLVNTILNQIISFDVVSGLSLDITVVGQALIYNEEILLDAIANFNILYKYIRYKITLSRWNIQHQNNVPEIDIPNKFINGRIN